jgi:hypothetical protein
MTIPDESATGSAAAGSNDTATFYLKSKVKGTYVSEVTNVTHATLTCDANANVETSETFTLQ